MATNNPAAVGVGAPKAGGAVFVAPKGTVVPTDATTELNEAFVCIGYITEDGVTLSEDSDTEELKAWGGDTVRKVRSSYAENGSFTPMQADADALKLAWGNDAVEVGQDGAIHVKHTAQNPEAKVIAIEMVLADNLIERMVWPSARLTERGEGSYNGSDSSGRELTFSLEPDAEGVTCHEYIAATVSSQG